MADHAAAWQEVRAQHPEFAGRTAAEDKPPPVRVLVVEVLDGVKDGGDVLGLVDDNRRRRVRLGHGQADLDQLLGAAEVTGPFAGMREIEAQAGAGEQVAEQGGFPGLARAEEDLDVGFGESVFPARLGPAVEHASTFNKCEKFAT